MFFCVFIYYATDIIKTIITWQVWYINLSNHIAWCGTENSTIGYHTVSEGMLRDNKPSDFYSVILKEWCFSLNKTKHIRFFVMLKNTMQKDATKLAGDSSYDMEMYISSSHNS